MIAFFVVLKASSNSREDHSFQIFTQLEFVVVVVDVVDVS
jgi:hypothetical protein